MDIFENQDQVVKNMNSSAGKLGIPDVIKPTKQQLIRMHKRNCKKCYGVGVFKHVAPDGREGQIPCTCSRIFQVTVPVEVKE